MTILIAGLGSIGRRHLSNLLTLGESDIILYRTGRSTLPDDDLRRFRVETSLTSALAAHPDVAIVANPTALHLETALQAAAAGCDLFVEKPLSHTLDSARELKDLVDRSGCVVMIGCQFRFHPLLISLKNGLEAGRLGSVVGARAEWGEYVPGWHPWEDHRRTYSARKDLGGGIILTLVHPLDYLYWLLGPVRRIHASAARIPCLETEVEDLAEITLEFRSGAIGQVHLDYIQRPPVHTLAVWGDAGRALWDYHAGTLTWTSSTGEAELERPPEGFDRNHMFLDEMMHFLDCVRRRERTRIPLEDGIAVLEMAMQARQDAFQGRYSDERQRAF